MLKTLVCQSLLKGAKTSCSYSLSRFKRVVREFQSISEYAKWKKDVQISCLRLRREESSKLEISQDAPFLHSVSPMASQLYLYGKKGSSLLECMYPLSKNKILRDSVTDFSNWSSFRLGKFYEIVDALSADVAYRHCKSKSNKQESIVLVTAGHYHSRKFHKTDILRDVILRSYITSVGKSSLEVRTDALQTDHDSSNEVLINVCHTVMVALDPVTGKSIGKLGRSLPSIELAENSDAKLRQKLAEKHEKIRRRRSNQAMQLRARVTAPPTDSEMLEIHKLHQQYTLIQERSSNDSDFTAKDIPPKVSQFTFKSSTITFPENRNVHGKLFGGFVMEEAQKLAQYAATFLSKGQPIISLGIDEAIFLQPISISNCVSFTARCVHTTEHCCRILVTAEVRDPVNRDVMPKRSNRLMFLFGGKNFPASIIPETYSEILMHIDARRRYEVEGPFLDEVNDVWAESVNTRN